MKTLRLYFTFYRSFVISSMAVTFISSYLTYTLGIGAFSPLFWFKIVTLGITFYYMHTYQNEAFYYYKNLGISERSLWLGSFAFDFSLFLSIQILILKIS